MFKFFGFYVDKGYYKVSFLCEQCYVYYDVNDLDVLKKFCGMGGFNFYICSMLGFFGLMDDFLVLEVIEWVLYVMKKIYISNWYYVYISDYKYYMIGYEMLLFYMVDIREYFLWDDKRYDGMVDCEWIIDVYNLCIYVLINGDNMFVVYSLGGNGFFNRFDYLLVFLNNVLMYEFWVLIWGL